MPRMGSAIYAAHMDSVLKLASRDEGVSRPQLMEELGVSRPVANVLIEKCALALDRKEGRTEFFKVNGTDVPVIEAPEVKQSTPEPTPELPPEVKEVAVPTTSATGEPDILDRIAELDAQIIDTRNTLRDAAKKAGTALGEWMTNEAMVDAMRQRLTRLAVERVSINP
jgi:hypothetical protein